MKKKLENQGANRVSTEDLSLCSWELIDLKI